MSLTSGLFRICRALGAILSPGATQAACRQKIKRSNKV